MQVQGAGGFQDAVHFQQAHRQKTEKGGDVVPVALTGGFDNLVQRTVFIPHLFQPDGMDFVPFPLVGQDAGVAPLPLVHIKAGGAGPVAGGVKGRVGGNQIHRFAVHPPQGGQVVEGIKGAVGEVLPVLGNGCHSKGPSVCGGFAIMIRGMAGGVKGRMSVRAFRDSRLRGNSPGCLPICGGIGQYRSGFPLTRECR